MTPLAPGGRGSSAGGLSLWHPRFPPHGRSSANILRLAGRHDEAKAWFARASGAQAPPEDPNPDTSAPAAASAGQAHARSRHGAVAAGRLDEAEASFREALRLDPTLAAAWNGVAQIDAERGDFEQSCEACRKAIALDSRQAEAYWRLATSSEGPDERSGGSDDGRPR